jgi:GNAT superfamily N-acetyltransferase
MVSGERTLHERKWQVREYRPDDINAVRELFGLVFHQLPPREYFIWKYYDNPAGAAIIMVAEDQGRIVGQQVLMPAWLRLGNKVVLGAQTVDTMTHPDYRNQGMSTALITACMELAAAKRVEVLYGFPNPIPFHVRVHKLNWDHAGDIPRWVRLLNPKSVASMSRPVRHVTSIGIHLLPIGNNAPDGVNVRMEPPTGDEWISVAGSGKTDSTCRIERSIDWFKWRFNSASQRRYVWFSAYREGELKAWAAFGVDEWNGVSLIDALGTETKALESVVSEATRYAKKLGIGALIAFTNDEDIVQSLKSCGYFQRRSLPLVVRSLTSGNLGANINLHGSWRIYSEDVDTF